MNRVEFVARVLCSSDGCHPDRLAFRAGTKLLQTPKVQLPPLPSQTEAAWKFYIDEACAVIRALDLYQAVKEKDDQAIAEEANRGRSMWSGRGSADPLLDQEREEALRA